SCFAIFLKTLGCAVQGVAPRARICDSPCIKVRQALRALLNSRNSRIKLTLACRVSDFRSNLARRHFANGRVGEGKACMAPTPHSTKTRKARPSRPNLLICL